MTLSKIEHKKYKKLLVKIQIIGTDNNKYFAKSSIINDIKLVITIQKLINSNRK